MRASNEIRERIDEISSSLKHLTEEDTKYECLKKALYDLWDEDETASRPARKVVLFAFFKPTLAYLSERLTADQVSSRLISGDVPIPERESRIDEFANDPDIRLLLSSEVGSEGLDLQFASVVVNYDLPWNPMVVEQRIGRIDRIGQPMPRVVILNLVATDTIEERILYRLYERIGVFEESVGEVDPILGEPVEKLAIDALRGDLTERQQDLLAEQKEKAWHDQRLQAEGLARNTDSLMAADQSFLDEIDGLIGRRKVPSASELHAYIGAYLSAHFAGSRFPKRLIERVSEIRTPSDVGHLVLRALPHDPEAVRFARMLQTGPVKATFDQDAALKHANAELIHARHPLVQAVMREGDRERDGLPRSFALRLDSADLADLAEDLEGDFAFEIHLLETGGVRPRVSLVPLFLDGENRLLDDSVSEDLLLAMLDSAVSLEPLPELAVGVADRLSGHLEEHLASRRSAIVRTVVELNTVRVERTRTTLAASLDHRVNEAKRRLLDLESKSAAAFAISMARAKLARAESERRGRLADMEDLAKPSIENELVAAGILCVAPVDIGTSKRNGVLPDSM